MSPRITEAGRQRRAYLDRVTIHHPVVRALNEYDRRVLRFLLVRIWDAGRAYGRSERDS